MPKSTGHALKERAYIGSVTPPDVFEDESREKNHGVHTNITMVQLPKGLWVRSFNGSSSYVNLGSGAAFDNCASLTFLAWIKRGVAETKHTLISDSNSSDQNKDHFLQLYVWDDDALAASWGDGTDYSWRLSTATIDTDWHFVAIGRDDVNEKVRFVIDGIAEPEQDYLFSLGTLTTLGADDLYIGRTGMSSFRRYFGGLKDLVRMCNYYLTPGQIKNIFEKERHWFEV